MNRLSKRALSVNPSPTMAIDSKAKEMKTRGIDVISFGVGEPDFDTPQNIREAGIEAIKTGHTRYTPAAGTQELKEAICDKFKTDNNLEYTPEQIVVSNGAKHSLSNALAALLNPGDEVLIPVPCWVSYPEMVKLNNGTPVIVNCSEENFFKVTIPDLQKHYTEKCKAIMINSPSNPTGQVYSEAELRSLADFCLERNIYIVADEIYEKLIYNNCHHVSIASFSEQARDMTVVVNGASKSFAMTGWRIGYTASTPQIARLMAAIQSHTTSNPNTIAQKAVLAALQGPQTSISEMRSAFDQRRRYMFERVQAIPRLSVLEPMGAFYLFVNIEKLIGKSFKGNLIVDDESFASQLLETYSVAIVPGNGFGSSSHVRLSFATSMEKIIEGMNHIESYVNNIE